MFSSGFFADPDPTRESGHEVKKTCGSSRVGSGGVGNFTGRVWSGQEVLEIAWVGSGRARKASKNLTGRVGSPRPDQTGES